MVARHIARDESNHSVHERRLEGSGHRTEYRPGFSADIDGERRYHFFADEFVQHAAPELLGVPVATDGELADGRKQFRRHHAFVRVAAQRTERFGHVHRRHI